MRVAALQFDVRPGDVAANLAAVERGLAEAAEAGVRLIVLPEMWPVSFVEPSPDALADTARALARLAELSAGFEGVVCGSSYGPAHEDMAPMSEARSPFNRLHAFEAGRQVLSYDKVHLFSPTAEDETFSAGRAAPATVRTSAGLLSGVICYDLRFAPLLAVPVAAGVEVLVCPAQWPAPRATHWRALVLGRAVEGQCFVVAANRTGREVVGRRRLGLEFPGNSLIADPHGVVLAEGDGRPGLVVADVTLDSVARLRRRVPVGKDRRDAVYRDWA